MSARALKAVVTASDRLYRSGVRTKNKPAELTAILITALVVSLRERRSPEGELLRLVMTVAEWKVQS